MKNISVAFRNWRGNCKSDNVSLSWILLGMAMLTGCTSERSNSIEENDLERLQGTWKCVQVTHDGKDSEADDIASSIGVLTVIEGMKATAFYGIDEIVSTFQLDTTKSPKQIVWTFPPDLPGEKEETVRELYKLEGNRFITCAHDYDPAKDFNAEKGSGNTLAIYEKVSR